MSNALSRLKDCAELWSEHPMTTLETKDLALLLAVCHGVEILMHSDHNNFGPLRHAIEALTKDTGEK